MKTFHDFFFGMSPTERSGYAAKAGVSQNYAEQVAGGFKLPSLRTAVKLVRASVGGVTVEDIVNEYEHRHGQIA